MSRPEEPNLGLFGISPRSDTESRTEYVTRILEFASINPRKHIAYIPNEPQKFSSVLLQNEYRARIASLMSLCFKPNAGFFDTPAPADMLTFATDQPERLMNHLRIDLGQAISLLVLRIHNDVSQFAQVVIDAVRDDPTMHLVFAHSTFPALYCFFTTRSLVKLGTKLIITITRQLVSKPESKQTLEMLVCEMIEALFVAAHGFWYSLWRRISENEISQMSEEDVLNLIIEAIKKEVWRLTKWHGKVLLEYEKVYGRESAMKLVFGILTNQLFLRARFGDALLSNEEYCILTDTLYSADGADVFLSLFVNNNGGKDGDLPDVPKGLVTRIPFLFSDRDIHMLCVIIPLNSTLALDSKDLIRQAEKMYAKGYMPFYADIAIPKNSLQVLTVPELKVSVPQDSPYASTIREMDGLQERNVCLSYLELLDGTPFCKTTVLQQRPRLNMSSDFIECVLDHKIRTFERDLALLDSVILVRENTAKMERWGEFVLDTSECLVSKYVYEQIEQKKKTKSRTLLRTSSGSIVNAVVKGSKDSPLASESVIASLCLVCIPDKDKAMKKLPEFTQAMASYDPQRLSPHALPGDELPLFLKRLVERAFNRGSWQTLVKLIQLVRLNTGNIIPYALKIAPPGELLSFIVTFERFLYQDSAARQQASLKFGKELTIIHDTLMTVLELCHPVEKALKKK